MQKSNLMTCNSNLVKIFILTSKICCSDKRKTGKEEGRLKLGLTKYGVGNKKLVSLRKGNISTTLSKVFLLSGKTSGGQLKYYVGPLRNFPGSSPNSLVFKQLGGSSHTYIRNGFEDFDACFSFQTFWGCCLEQKWDENSDPIRI